MGDAIQHVRKFIIDRQEQPTAFDDADDLIENGLVDSLQFVEFVMLIAELSGKEIALDDLDIEQFRTIHSIRRAFFSSIAVGDGIGCQAGARP